MKIKEITWEKIIFEDGSEIAYDHDQDCCENNYADFEQLDDIARNYDFDISKDKPMRFEPVEDSGFRFGDWRQMFFVPCYSEQNGYYTTEINIYYDNNEVLRFNCEFVDC